MIYIPRGAQVQFDKFLATPKVTIILEACQVGKTTLVEHALRGRKALFLNLNLELDQRRLEAAATLAPRDALLSLGAPEVLVIDEAQRLPQTGRMHRQGVA